MNMALFVVLAVLQCVDIYTTYTVIVKQKGRELNPIMDYIMGKLGILRGLIVAKSVLLAVIYCMPEASKAIVLWFGVALYVIIAYNNIKVMRR